MDHNHFSDACVTQKRQHETNTYDYIELYHFLNYYRCRRVTVRVVSSIRSHKPKLITDEHFHQLSGLGSE